MTETTTTDAKSLDELSRDELRKLAAERGIKGMSKAAKPALLAALSDDVVDAEPVEPAVEPEQPKSPRDAMLLVARTFHVSEGERRSEAFVKALCPHVAVFEGIESSAGAGTAAGKELSEFLDAVEAGRKPKPSGRLLQYVARSARAVCRAAGVYDTPKSSRSGSTSGGSSLQPSRFGGTFRDGALTDDELVEALGKLAKGNGGTMPKASAAWKALYESDGKSASKERVAAAVAELTSATAAS